MKKKASAKIVRNPKPKKVIHCLNKFVSVLIVTVLLASNAFGAASLMGPPNPQFFNNSNTPCNACKLYFYTTGTDTAKDTWTDATQAVLNSNPITLNTRGEAASGIFMNGTYRVKLTTSSGTVLWQRDGITGLSDAALTATLSRWQASGKTPTYVSGTTFTTSGDNTALFVAGRRVEIVDTSTLYGRITSSTYGGGLTTTVVSLDTGAISSSISSVSVSLETPTNTSLSFDMVSSGTSSANIISNGSNTFTGTNVHTGSESFNGTTTFQSGLTSNGTSTFTGGVVSSGSNTFTGSNVISNVTLSTVTKTGTTVVTNLNADMLDGAHSSQTPTIGEIPVIGSVGMIAVPVDMQAKLYIGRYNNANQYGMISAAVAGNPNSTGIRIDVKGSGGTPLPALYAEADGTLKDSTGTQIANLNSSVASATTSTRLTDGTNAIHIKVIDIGDWNMDTTGNVSVSHGLTLSKIRSVSCMIRNDDGSGQYMLTPGLISTATEVDGYIESVSSTSVFLQRRTGGQFDAATFDATSYNRGWVTITYID